MKSVTYISHRRRFNLFSKSFHLKTIFEKIFLVDFVFLPLCLKIKRIYSYGFKTIDRRVRYEMLQAVFIGHLKCAKTLFVVTLLLRQQPLKPHHLVRLIKKGPFETKQMEFQQLKKRCCGNRFWTRGQIFNHNCDITKGMIV